ncbi:DUF4174 domain-containing protein [Hymenobacter sp. GOD-10R]|uniref:DUF4174 domain-containing protein n=1 Tax=Hymenobacter sp. GOD-10R TaxID=3093922 RepID=UPI002D7800EA|nr:DUF4174 domain-containing protein [Hymenobacter sp. GOD-10R]WRQ30325.1 DUF4174 domain-containing protein [Hymenobacter sp. GOD-10R]
MTQSTQQPSLAETLRAGKWEKRMVLLYAPAADNAEFKQQKSLLAQAQGAVHDRDIRVLELTANQLSAADKQYLQQQLKVEPTQFTVLLIGKDGGVKLRQTKALTAQQLFGTIDKMPMRQQEMKKH